VDTDRAVEIGHGEVRLVLHTPEPGYGLAERVTATLVGSNLDATSSIYLYAPRGLPAFFSELAADWRGWDGTREWISIEGDLHLVCYHDRLGHVAIEVSMGRLPPPRWHEPGWMVKALVTVDPGALQVLATALGHLLIEP
jgi:Family of unknown function (DUF6228)